MHKTFHLLIQKRTFMLQLKHFLQCHNECRLLWFQQCNYRVQHMIFAKINTKDWNETFETDYCLIQLFFRFNVHCLYVICRVTFTYYAMAYWTFRSHIAYSKKINPCYLMILYFHHSTFCLRTAGYTNVKFLNYEQCQKRSKIVSFINE